MCIFQWGFKKRFRNCRRMLVFENLQCKLRCTGNKHFGCVLSSGPCTAVQGLSASFGGWNATCNCTRIVPCVRSRDYHICLCYPGLLERLFKCDQTLSIAWAPVILDWPFFCKFHLSHGKRWQVWIWDGLILITRPSFYMFRSAWIVARRLKLAKECVPHIFQALSWGSSSCTAWT